MKNLEKILDVLSTIVLIIVGLLGIFVTVLDFIGKDFQSGPWQWLKGPIPVILLTVAWLALALGLERIIRFRQMSHQIESIENLVKETTSAILKSLTKSVAFCDSVKDTEYDFINMARSATKSIFLIGPNLNFLIRQTSIIKPLLFKKMTDSTFHIRFLISDPESKAICEVMSRVAFTGAFSSELEMAIIELQKWKSEANSHRPRPLNLLIRKTDVVTMSLLFIDGEDIERGRLLLIPIPWRVEGGQRPAFIITRKQNQQAFDKYWGAYDTMFNSPAFSTEL